MKKILKKAMVCAISISMMSSMVYGESLSNEYASKASSVKTENVKKTS